MLSQIVVPVQYLGRARRPLSVLFLVASLVIGPAASEAAEDPAAPVGPGELDDLMGAIRVRLEAMKQAAAKGDQALKFLAAQVDEAVQSLSGERDRNTTLARENSELDAKVASLAESQARLDQAYSHMVAERDLIVTGLQSRVADLAELLSLEGKAKAELGDQAAALSAELRATLNENEALDRDLVGARLAETAQRERIGELTERLGAAETKSAKIARELKDAYMGIEAGAEKIQSQLQDIATLRSLESDLQSKLTAAETARDEVRILSDRTQDQVLLLNRQILALRRQLAGLAETLESSEVANTAKDVQIADLGRRLNVALASKVQELARYRSEFFGRLRDVLGERQGIRIVGDRFVFPSEVLFATGSSKLGTAGQAQMAQLGDTLKEIAAKIPEDLRWVLRVDGHTDRRPISTDAFPSNWELSTARAISVVRFLIEQGISADHLAATGFGEFQPLDPGDHEAAFRRNRRIELKLTQK